MAAAAALVVAWWCAPVAASAATSGGRYAAWTLTGASTAFAGTVSLGTGFPAITYTSDSRAPASISSGATAFLPAGSPFGARYGSSANQPYLNLRPKADNATSPSTTTYTFASPTPADTWAVNFGDLDAEVLTISALGVGGSPVAAADLGVQAAYNYCDASPRSSSCTGQVAPFALPTVTTTATSVTAQDLLCPSVPARCDTQGASLWLQPTVPVTSLTVVSTWKQGLPSYQTWFATRLAGLSGAVMSACPVAGPLTAALLDANGVILAQQAVDATGHYSFADLAAMPRYDVRVEPAGLGPDQSADTVTSAPVLDAVTAPDLVISTAAAVSGSVHDAAGVPAVGVAVTLTEAGGTVQHTSTDAAGHYSFVAIATKPYEVRVAAAPGTHVTPPTRTVTPGCAGAVLDPFVETPAPSSSAPATPTPTTTSAPTAAVASHARAVAPVQLANTGPSSREHVAVGVAAMTLGGALVLAAARGRRGRQV